MIRIIIIIEMDRRNQYQSKLHAHSQKRGIERETEKSAQSSLGFARNEIEFFFALEMNDYVTRQLPPAPLQSRS